MHRAVGVFVAVCAAAAPSVAQDQPAEPPPAPTPSEGVLPLLDYGGDLPTRQFLTGDWGGTRTELANKGLTFDFNWTQYAQGVVAGGRRIDWDYGGHFDYLMNIDLMRMGVLPGAVVGFRAESRYGEAVNDDVGVLLPVNTTALAPLTSPNEGVPFTITELKYTQFLSPQFGLLVGKIQTLDGDPNEFASGRGRLQFMNSNFIYNPSVSLTVPYSTLGGGLIWLPTDKITVSTLLMNTLDSSTTSGFENTGKGLTWATEADFQYKLGSLPGGQNVTGIYAFANDFVQLGGRLQFVPGEGVMLPRHSTSWAVTWSMWQYVYTPDRVPDKINLHDGRPDVRGIGLFARAGVADSDANPVEYSLSGGVGGRGLIPGRDDDTYGVGYFYTQLENLRAFAVLNLEDKTQGVEAYYNFAITRSVGLTFDFQWVDGGSQNTDPAIVLGFRLDMRF